jgi:hypothetical protein
MSSLFRSGEQKYSRAALEAASLDGPLRDLEARQRLEELDRATRRQGLLGRFAIKKAKSDLSDQITAGRAKVEALRDRAGKAHTLIAGVPSPAVEILGSEEIETNGLAEEIQKFNTKLRTQKGPGVLKDYASHDASRHGSCVLCGRSISDRTDTFVAFQESSDVALVSDHPTSLRIRTTDTPHGAVEVVRVNDAERHGLYAHPLLPESQETASRLLSLESYVNPEFDGKPDVTSVLGTPL